MSADLEIVLTLYPAGNGTHEGVMTATSPDGLVFALSVDRWVRERPGVVKARGRLQSLETNPQSDADLAAWGERMSALARAG